ncbi:hypothetical protein GCM10027053_06120 [Intrasporangium mesophilum]
MTTLRAQVTIDAPAAAVWDVVAHRFDHVADWATVIPASHPAPGDSRVLGAPVAGRVCTTGLGAVAEVTERIVSYDEAGRTLTYEAEGLPPFLRTARNRWRVTALGDQRSRVDLEAALQVHGVLGWVLYPVIRLQIAHITPGFLADLKHFVETGRPSRRKQRQLDARITTARRP